jgi:hypothetical protein
VNKLSIEEFEEWVSIINPRVKEFLSKLRREGVIKNFPSKIDVDKISKKIGEILFDYWKKNKFKK